MDEESAEIEPEIEQSDTESTERELQQSAADSAQIQAEAQSSIHKTMKKLKELNSNAGNHGYLTALIIFCYVYESPTLAFTALSICLISHGVTNIFLSFSSDIQCYWFSYLVHMLDCVFCSSLRSILTHNSFIINCV